MPIPISGIVTNGVVVPNSPLPISEDAIGRLRLKIVVPITEWNLSRRCSGTRVPARLRTGAATGCECPTANEQPGRLSAAARLLRKYIGGSPAASETQPVHLCLTPLASALTINCT